MKTAWVCLWVAIAAAEVGLTVWSRSAMFLWIGSIAPLMVAYNLQRQIRITRRQLAEAV